MTTLAIDWRKKALTVAILVAGATIAGPFGTYEELSAGGRLLYWGVAILGCGVIMEALLITALTHPILRLRPIVRLSAAVVLGSFPAAVLVLALEHGLRGYAPTPDFALRIWLLVLGIGFLVSVVEYRSALRAIAPARPAPPAKTLPAEATGTSPSVVPPDPQHWDLFFRALDPALGRSLISLTKQDHYLKVVTREGEALILKRMADAVAELDGYPGMQVHRSHWVAFEAVEAVERATGRWVVRLSDGRTLPVSRPNAAPLRAAIDPPRGHAM
jgi:hypothetical protein